MKGTGEKFSRFSRAFSNMSDFYSVTSTMSAEFGTIIMERQQSKAGRVIVFREDGITGGRGSGAESEEKIVCLISPSDSLGAVA